MPPAPVTDNIVFGGPGSIPLLSDDEERYVLALFELFLILRCLNSVEYALIFVLLTATRVTLPVPDVRLLLPPLVWRLPCVRQHLLGQRPLQPLLLHQRTRLWQHPILRLPLPVLLPGKNT